MRLLLDEHVNPAVARKLRDRGHDVVTVEESGMRAASDEQLLDSAASRGRALVTYNVRDFVLLMAEWHRLAKHHSGIIFVNEKTISQKNVGALVRALERVLKTARFSAGWLDDSAIFLSRTG